MSAAHTRDNAGKLLQQTSGVEINGNGNTSAFVAANVASELGIVLAADASERSEALSSQSQILSSDSAYMRKASAVSTDSVSHRDIQTYVVASGESVNDIARKFGVKSDTIRWANDLGSSEGVSAGDELVILPVDGVLHTVASGDTADSLADKYEANATQIIRFNDAEINGLSSGQKIVIPGGVKPAPEPSFNPATSNFANSFVPMYGQGSVTVAHYTDYANSSGYARGWCTDWAYYRSAQLGNTVGSNWGNAISWTAHAQAAGYYVGGQPKVGAVVYWPGRNHVGVVEEVSSDGSMIKYSDMNGLAGWGNAAQTVNWVPASSYLYIY